MTREHDQLLRDAYAGVPSAAFDLDCARLDAGEPLAYVIGWQPFLGLKIRLDSHPLIHPGSAKATQGTRPLIPRPETEWWSERLLATVNPSSANALTSSMSHSATAREEAIRQQANMPLAASESSAPLRLLDLCAGSGAIGCAALKYLPQAEVYFGEIDAAHEMTIRRNIRENHLDASRAHIGIGDLFAPFAGQTFDIIAANPPYIPSGRTLDASVADHEPVLALFSGEDGLELIGRIAQQLRVHLAPGGTLWLECDSTHADAARDLFTSHGFTASIHTDQYDLPRYLVVS